MLNNKAQLNNISDKTNKKSFDVLNKKSEHFPNF